MTAWLHVLSGRRRGDRGRAEPPRRRPVQPLSPPAPPEHAAWLSALGGKLSQPPQVAPTLAPPPPAFPAPTQAAAAPATPVEPPPAPPAPAQAAVPPAAPSAAAAPDEPGAAPRRGSPEEPAPDVAGSAAAAPSAVSAALSAGAAPPPVAAALPGLRKGLAWLRGWRAAAGRASAPPVAEPGEAPAAAGLARAFEQLCAELGRPFSAAEIRAAAPPAAGGMTLPNLMLAAERLGFKAAEVKPDAQVLSTVPRPFVLVGRQPGEGWLVRERVGDHLVLQDLAAGTSAAVQVDTAADLALRVVLLKPDAQGAKDQRWRRSIMQRLRPVLWELAIASVVINLLALATPLFLMTVYNTVAGTSSRISVDPSPSPNCLRCMPARAGADEASSRPVPLQLP
jgi:Peptidase C39 family